MNILIAGGTGFIGQSLTRHFLQSQHHVFILSRDVEKVKKIFGNQVQAITWSELYLNLFRKMDWIINLCGASIGEKRWSKARKQEILQSRIYTTQKLCDFCSQLGENSPALINASAVGVYDFVSKADTKYISFDENTTIAYDDTAPHFLAQVARNWETATWNARDQKVKVINTRFAVVLGPQGGMLKQLLPIFKLGLGFKIASGQQPFTWVSLRDVIRAIQFIIDNPAMNHAINILSPQLITQEKFADSLATALKRPRFLTFPAWKIKFLFGQMGEELLLSGTVAKPQKLLEHGFTFIDTDIDETLKNYCFI